MSNATEVGKTGLRYVQWGSTLGEGQIIKGLSAILRDKCFSTVRNHEGTPPTHTHTHRQAALSSQAPGRSY